jgi:molecular chaperone Hsp33
MNPQDRDSLHRFLFEQMPVRGEIVHLDAAWRAAAERVEYPDDLRKLLGEAMAATVLLSSTLKFDGALTLQLQGNGPLSLLVVQCTSGLNLRGLARTAEDFEGDITGLSLRELVGSEGRMVITLEQEGQSERYQGIVPLEGETLAECFEAYFQRSEQLPTRLFLSADAQCAAGMLLQVMPGSGDVDAAWEHVTTLGETIEGEELRTLDAQTILHRLYHEEDVRLFESSPVAFRCSCSRDRIVSMLRGLGEEEVNSIVAEQGKVSVECQFCGRTYEFDAVDARAVFTVPVTSDDRRNH